MGEILNALGNAEAELEHLLSASLSEILATLAVPAFLILLAMAAALLRHATVSLASVILAVLALGLQVMDVETQWRVLGFASVAVLSVLMIILQERRLLVRQLREDMLDMEARFDGFLTALDQRHALLESRGAPQSEILPPAPTAPISASTSPEPVD